MKKIASFFYMCLFTAASNFAYSDALYVASNKEENNTVVAFKQLENDQLQPLGEFKKGGGEGTGDLYRT